MSSKINQNLWSWDDRMKFEFLFDVFCDYIDREHSINWDNFGFSLMIKLFVEPNNWFGLTLKSFHSEFDSLRIIVGASTGFSSFNQPINKDFIVALNKKQTLDFELRSNNWLPRLLIFKISRKTYFNFN